MDGDRRTAQDALAHDRAATVTLVRPRPRRRSRERLPSRRSWQRDARAQPCVRWLPHGRLTAPRPPQQGRCLPRRGVCVEGQGASSADPDLAGHPSFGTFDGRPRTPVVRVLTLKERQHSDCTRGDPRNEGTTVLLAPCLRMPFPCHIRILPRRLRTALAIGQPAVRHHSHTNAGSAPTKNTDQWRRAASSSTRGVKSLPLRLAGNR